MVSYGAEVFAFLDGRLDSRAPWVVVVVVVVVARRRLYAFQNSQTQRWDLELQNTAFLLGKMGPVFEFYNEAFSVFGTCSVVALWDVLVCSRSSRGSSSSRSSSFGHVEADFEFGGVVLVDGRFARDTCCLLFVSLCQAVHTCLWSINKHTYILR